jgi:hypothetical protein
MEICRKLQEYAPMKVSFLNIASVAPAVAFTVVLPYNVALYESMHLVRKSIIRIFCNMFPLGNDKKMNIMQYLILVIISLQVIYIFQQSSSTNTWAQTSISITGKLGSETVMVGEDLMVHLNVTNNSDLPVEDFDLQLMSEGFRTVSEKEWPETIYANSTVTGTCLLQALFDGRHQVSASVTYMMNMPMTGAQARQFGFSDEIGEVEVKSEWMPEFSTYWQAAVSAAGGAIVGFLAPRIGETIFARSTAEREKRARIAKAKSILLRELKLNERNVQNSLPASVQGWDLLQSEGVYYLLAENNELEPVIPALYSEFLKYNRKTNEERAEMDKTQLLRLTHGAIETTKRWEVS